MPQLQRVIVTAAAAALAVVFVPPATAAPVVERIAGATRTDTAAALARAATTSPRTVHLVTSTDFADGLAAGVAAAARDGVVLLVDPDGVPPATRTALSTFAAAELVVTGGSARVPPAVVDEIARIAGRQPVRVAGTDRYATAAALAVGTFGQRAPGQGMEEVWVTSGTSAADALSAGAAAAQTGGALLLTAPERLSEATRSAVVALQPDRVTVVGGEAAVGPTVVDELEAVVGDGRVRRIRGADRYKTSAAVASTTFDAASAAVVTTGRFWADALAATPLAARLQAPVILVPRRCVPAAAVPITSSVDRVVIAGGEAAVSPRVEQLAACADEITGVTAEDLGPSWRPGCPVAPHNLRRITVDYRALDGTGVRVGGLVVHRSVAANLIGVFDELFTAGFRLERVTTVDEFGGEDATAMAANATTAFNCRVVAGSWAWSEHAYGTAVDINPVQNPYVSASGVQPPAGAAYVDRSRVRPGMVVAGGVVERAFNDVGWSWGGRWRSAKDYQHFSASGR